ncbi:uncharacterized protein J3D65DRAFT_603955 [Phyllosticta citribraziliensis]|uniref:Uncharacterized protein n=1 Tax=Phyllosticta citribraziliensis TaxID=989973 RepID=A0ABR1LM06_9PEZI
MIGKTESQRAIRKRQLQPDLPSSFIPTVDPLSFSQDAVVTALSFLICPSSSRAIVDISGTVSEIGGRQAGQGHDTTRHDTTADEIMESHSTAQHSTQRPRLSSPQPPLHDTLLDGRRQSTNPGRAALPLPDNISSFGAPTAKQQHVRVHKQRNPLSNATSKEHLSPATTGIALSPHLRHTPWAVLCPALIDPRCILCLGLYSI